MKIQFKVHSCVVSLLGAAVSLCIGNACAAAPASSTAAGTSASWDFGAPVHAPGGPVSSTGVASGRADLAGSAVTTASTAAAPAATPPTAAIPPEPTWSTYYRSVDAIHADSQLTQAKIENAKLHHELDQISRGISNDNGSAQPSAASVTTSSSQRNALVQEVKMVDGRWTANIQLPSGARVAVHLGDSVRGLGKIQNIELGQVTVDEGGLVSTLQFAGDGLQDVAAQPTGSTVHPLPRRDARRPPLSPLGS
ncbi:type IV pilus biogenesis protein PilP [Paraburkholderia sp. GAS448]|uniref:type IV pilus biogenesis protein PilP n=1 Tax=Paraburkholderia sp. GAS448 TaxID=3035136 RepID=UPI003D23D8DB